MQEVKRVGIWSVAKIFLFFGIAMGLIFGIYYSLMIANISSINPLLAEQIGVMTGGQIFMIFIVMLLVISVMSFLSGIIGAALYNLFAKMIGGIKVDLVAKK